MKYRVVRIDGGIGINETPVTGWTEDKHQAVQTARGLADEFTGTKFVVRASTGLTVGEYVSFVSERGGA